MKRALTMLALALTSPVASAPTVPPKPRIIVISDIGNEPDDQMSLVRYLTYSNEVDTEGLIACTSTWLRTNPHPEIMHSVIAAYGEVRDNLMKHEQGWPAQAALDALVTSAGVAEMTPFMDLDAATFRSCLLYTSPSPRDS